MAANGTIAGEFQNEKLVHIIDFEIAQGAPIQALAALPGGPPHLQITGVDDPASGLAGMSPTGGVELVGQKGLPNLLGSLLCSIQWPKMAHMCRSGCWSTSQGKPVLLILHYSFITCVMRVSVLTALGIGCCKW